MLSMFIFIFLDGTPYLLMHSYNKLFFFFFQVRYFECFFYSKMYVTNLINSFTGSQGLKQIASWPNHTSYRKVHFIEFVQNSLHCNMGMIIFDLHGYGGCQRSKTPLGGQKQHEGVDLLKKVFNESFSTISKTPQRIQSDLSYNLRVESFLRRLPTFITLRDYVW